MNEWNKLKVDIKHAKSAVKIFKKSNITKRKENLLLCIYDSADVKLYDFYSIYSKIRTF